MYDQAPHDTGHDWWSAVVAIDNGKMDRFDLTPGGNTNGDFLAYSQMSETDIPRYWKYAQNFVLSDRMFSSTIGPSSAQSHVRHCRNGGRCDQCSGEGGQGPFLGLRY